MLAIDHSVARIAYAVLRRNVLYTGVARGKRLVVLVGQKKSIAKSDSR
jgi:ATP-dependent exoDNAse (exonuclease V) alpha subunit